jgi:RimJ/RimL family protein N-acetyltransferase
MEVDIRQAGIADLETLSSILHEAVAWLEQEGKPMWREDEIQTERLQSDIAGGLYFVAECAGQPAGMFKFQLSDERFWPDVPNDDSVFIHRLAVRRRHAGGMVSSAILSWAVARGVALGRRYVRLDCDAARPRLRAVYERFGFEYHSERQVGPYLVARYQYALTDRDRRA